MVSNNRNILVVEALYEALAGGDTEKAVKTLVPDLEWWFHGPPRCQHMMRLLTGEAGHRDFRFRPVRVAEVGAGWVVAEGWEGEQDYWVHVWAVKGGIITQFREYFNTSITVRDLRGAPADPGCAAGRREGPTVWQSRHRERLGRSLPGLILAI